jgi:hypothetical protein
MRACHAYGAGTAEHCVVIVPLTDVQIVLLSVLLPAAGEAQVLLA